MPETTAPYRPHPAASRFTPEGPLSELRFDTEAAVARAIGVLDELEARLPGLATLPGFGAEDLAELRAVAGWALDVERRWQASRDVPSDDDRAAAARGALIQASWAKRRALLTTAKVLATRGDLPKEELAALDLRRTRRGLAEDLQALANLFLRHFEALAGRVPFEREELEAVAPAFAELKLAVMPRPRRKKRPSELELERRRAFTVLLERWARLRAATSVLRASQKDGDDLVPSLHVRRPKRPAEAASDREARAEARGVLLARRAAVLEVLTARGLDVPQDVRARIERSTDAVSLKRWLERAAVATEASELLWSRADS